MRRCSTSPIKTTMGCHFTPIRLAIAKQNKAEENIKHLEIKVLSRMRRKSSSRALLLGIQNGATAVENGMLVPQTLNHRLPHDPAIPLRKERLQETRGAILDTLGLRHLAPEGVKKAAPESGLPDGDVNLGVSV